MMAGALTPTTAAALARVAASVPQARPSFDRDLGHYTGHPLDPRSEDDGDDEELDTREDLPSPHPLMNAAAVIEEAAADAKKAAERIGQPSAAAAIEAGRLRAELSKAADLVTRLQFALQLAVEHAHHGDDYLQTEGYRRAVRDLGILAAEATHG